MKINVKLKKNKEEGENIDNSLFMSTLDICDQVIVFPHQTVGESVTTERKQVRKT